MAKVKKIVEKTTKKKSIIKRASKKEDLGKELQEDFVVGCVLPVSVNDIKQMNADLLAAHTDEVKRIIHESNMSIVAEVYKVKQYMAIDFQPLTIHRKLDKLAVLGGSVFVGVVIIIIISFVKAWLGI